MTEPKLKRAGSLIASAVMGILEVQWGLSEVASIGDPRLKKAQADLADGIALALEYGRTERLVDRKRAR